MEKIKPSLKSIKLIIAKLNPEFKPYILPKCSQFMLLHANKSEKLSNLRPVKYLVSHNGISIHTINSSKSRQTQSPM